MQYSNSLKSSIIGNADIPKSATFPPSSSKSTCNNNPPKVNKKKVTKLGAGHDVNQTRGRPIREAKALIADINKVDQPSALAKKVAESDAFLSLTAVAIIVLSLGIFGLVVWAVLG